MRKLWEIQEDIMRYSDIRKMNEMAELLDELTQLFDAKENANKVKEGGKID